MEDLSKSDKKFARWAPRLMDDSWEVQREAAEIMVQIANSSSHLRHEALSALRGQLTFLLGKSADVTGACQ